MKIVAPTPLLKSLLYNLELFSPNKGEAKKANGRGEVYLRSVQKLDGQLLYGLATDDHYSFCGWIPLQTGTNDTILTSVEEIRKIRGSLDGDSLSEVEFQGRSGDDSFTEVFWEGHVTESISGVAKQLSISYFSLNPERLRKLSLLEPRGYPIHKEFVEWADRTIIRFNYTENFSGAINLVGSVETNALHRNSH